jgi:probable biosynthetic protein (TIGR04098 family)
MSEPQPATRSSRLVLGLPHTNRDGLAEHLLLMHAGHLYWSAIARASRRKLSTLRSASGENIYATFYYIEEDFPAGTPLSTFQVDDELRFLLALRAFKNLAMDGRMLFDAARRLPSTAQPIAAGRHPFIRLASIFTERSAGNRRLKIAAPVDADFSGVTPLPDRDNAFHVTRAAERSGELGLIGDGWAPVSAHQTRYIVDPDRDTNGAGLLYFANYALVVNIAEREALHGIGRDLRQRRLAYYGNAEPDEVLRITVDVFARNGRRGAVAVRGRVHRDADDQLICLSEAILQLRETP